MSKYSPNLKNESHHYIKRISKHQAQRSLLHRTKRRTSSIGRTNHQDVKGIHKHKPLQTQKTYPYTQAALRAQVLHVHIRHFTHKRQNHTHNPLRSHKPYTYAQSTLREKCVFVHTSCLKSTSRICTHKPLNAQKTYTNIRKRRTTYANPHTLRKDVHKRTQKPYNLRKAA